MAQEPTVRNTRELKQLLKELFGDEQVGGLWISEDQTRISGNVYIDGQVCQLTYQLDPDSGQYKLQGHNPLGKLKL
jgi:hypothetical protein